MLQVKLQMAPVNLDQHHIWKLALALLNFVCYSLNVAKLQKEMDHAEEVYKLLTVCTESFKYYTNPVL